MALIFFSGGVDSTVLAFDVAQHPYRYGVESGERLVLLSLTFGKSGQKARQLSPLVHELRKVSKVDVVTRVVECPLVSMEIEPVPEGGVQSLFPETSTGADWCACPYTKGMHIWLASWACNIGEPQAMFGFMYDRSQWESFEEEPPGHSTQPGRTSP